MRPAWPRARGGCGPGVRSPGIAQVGDVATFSFFPTKNLSTFGDGGLITTPRDDVADTCRTLRFHGSRDKQTFTQIGYNSRLDELHAAVLRVFLEGVPGWNAARQAAAARYRDLGLDELATLPPDGGVYHLYMARVAERDRVVDAARRPASAAASTTRGRCTGSRCSPTCRSATCP